MSSQFDTHLTRRQVLQGIGGGAAAIALAGSGTLRSARAATAQAQSAPAGEVAFHGTGFEPMTVKVTEGETVAFHNVSNDPMQLETAPTAPVHMTASAAAGKRADVKFDKPGLYLLFDPRTTRFDEKVGQVVAEKNSPNFPLPAYLVVLCVDQQGAGLQLTSPNIVIPASTMTFTPWSIVVSAGQPIHFTNNDSDMHIAMPSPAPMLMPKPSGGQLGQKLWMEKMSLFAPINLSGGGGTGVLTIAQPGLHHYYCPIHCQYDPARYTFAPLPVYGGFPYIMDGVIVVQPK